MSGKLTPFQDEVLYAFFERESGFFLTGGAALAGFHLKHRETSDLDLFTTSASAFERGRHVVGSVAEACEATLEVRQDAPGFERFALLRGEQGLVLDLVLERVKQLYGEKLNVDGVRVDPAEEILANKLTTLVSRCEERDIVDVMFLERAGLRVEDALPGALEKDGGCTPATLAWLLSELRIGDGAKLPAGVTVPELRAYVERLVPRLRRAAAPKSPNA